MNLDAVLRRALPTATWVAAIAIALIGASALASHEQYLVLPIIGLAIGFVCVRFFHDHFMDLNKKMFDGYKIANLFTVFVFCILRPSDEIAKHGLSEAIKIDPYPYMMLPFAVYLYLAEFLIRRKQFAT